MVKYVRESSQQLFHHYTLCLVQAFLAKVLRLSGQKQIGDLRVQKLLGLEKKQEGCRAALASVCACRCFLLRSFTCVLRTAISIPDHLSGVGLPPGA